MSKIGKAGPQNAAILDTERSIIEKDNSKILVMDNKLSEKIKFIKEGQFVEKEGAPTLKLIGDVVPIDRVEVIKKVKENLIKEYPLSATELATAIIDIDSNISQNKIWEVIKDNGIKNNVDYSAYNFRNKKKEDEYMQTGKISKSTPSIYNNKAIDFIIKIIKNETT